MTPRAEEACVRMHRWSTSEIAAWNPVMRLEVFWVFPLKILSGNSHKYAGVPTCSNAALGILILAGEDSAWHTEHQRMIHLNRDLFHLSPQHTSVLQLPHQNGK